MQKCAELILTLRECCTNGVRVILADVVTERVDALVAELNVQAVPVDAALTTECDIFSPCAVGGVLNEQSIPRLRCRIVAGAANNQLETIEDDERLRDAGVVYAPNLVINSGGVLHGVGFELWGLAGGGVRNGCRWHR